MEILFFNHFNAKHVGFKISENLQKACKKIKRHLLVFERKLEIKENTKFNYISDLKGIKEYDLKNKNILLAIGSRALNDTAEYYIKKGANIFTRVIQTPESISRAFGSCIKNSNIAILEPSKLGEFILEKKLCDYWKIDYIICRDSGGYSQFNWQQIISERNIQLFLVARPEVRYKSPYFFTEYDNLIYQITNKN